MAAAAAVTADGDDEGSLQGVGGRPNRREGGGGKETPPTPSRPVGRPAISAFGRSPAAGQLYSPWGEINVGASPTPVPSQSGGSAKRRAAPLWGGAPMAWASRSGGNVGLIVSSRRGAVEAAAAAAAVAIVPCGTS